MRHRENYIDFIDIRREVYTGRVEVCQNGEFVDVCSDINDDISTYFTERICNDYSGPHSKSS